LNPALSLCCGLLQALSADQMISGPDSVGHFTIHTEKDGDRVGGVGYLLVRDFFW
jgi:hypothetical protein